ncbi:uncharacterized protein LOC8068864 [Sorghum bicolor]|uniref:F-box domain-containing protein n=1 Tax=Sorghum bicolor TaxID=4558 RepID=A0A1B6PDH4_SORBI|nr:uncharacterized protein LOC8068864 [Sorghum bicolor]XP_021302255.1 uncharacterized protein LOC8068864 [Sorghum bicolor]KXG23740.1 hypothetical protein SORBI_3008G134100 [Sorghum bicolor]KXG23741.1 hypothetical protein SORBI_3008G134100 [Sorghum bicolor]OQU79359.1 hypothetical protein SORBI_3008G134100 [Sorghum bicolor]OQU79360.1 hypothetical protein SORBI_3008G134100 [Sorghum bicolor]OQU79361.1 hypothetical protein SORBI_3008G134100 [Sorghum bicolor]|eukprot:XP_002442343.2 uncharacterized protein LOC8068864 [Sorghum bicolor]
MAAPPELVDDAMEEIFLRLPPAEPAHLVRAALVCRRWRRILTGGAFVRRYRAFHGAAPLLGFLDNTIDLHGARAPRFSPTSSASPFHRGPFDCICWDVLDCRHGRVLLGLFAGRVNLVVWDPVTGHHQALPDPGLLPGYYSAAVLCGTARGGCGCDNLHCCRDGGGPFRVVLAGMESMDYFARGEDAGVRARLYCSEAAAWVASAHLPSNSHVMRKPSAVVGDDVYFQLMSAYVILRYDTARNRLSTFDPPPAHADEGGIVLMPMDGEDGDGSSQLGLAGVRGSRLCLRSTSVGAEGEGIAGWVRRGDIELMTRIPFLPYSEAQVIASAEGLGTIFFFVSTEVGLFAIDFKSGQERKVSEPGNYNNFTVFPFMSFYTPDCRSGKLPSPRRTD